jgi:hypothetical protein
VWDLISRLLKDPERLKAGLEEMIEQERAELRGDPDQEAKSWLERLAEVDQERRGYLRLAAKGRLTDEELDEALAELEDARETAEKELRAVRARREVLEDLERDRDALLESYASMTPAALDTLSSEERHHVYKMLRLTVEVSSDGSLDVTGVLGNSFVSKNQHQKRRLCALSGRSPRAAFCSCARRVCNRVGSGSSERGLHPIPRRICLSSSDPGVAETVDSAGTLFREGEPVLGRSVAAVAPKAIAGMGLGEGAHRVVAEDLGHNTRSGDRRAPSIGLGQALHLRAERQVAVRKTAPGSGLQQ